MCSEASPHERDDVAELKAILAAMDDTHYPDTRAWLELVIANSESLAARGERLSVAELAMTLVPVFSNLETRISELSE